MFKDKVVNDLSYAPGRLKDADEIAENRLRRFIKGLIREKHTPRRSDLRPIGDFIGHTIGGLWAARSGDVEEADKHVEALTKFQKDHYYKQRKLLNDALHIADSIPVDNILNFYQATQNLDLSLILPEWKRIVQPRALEYRKKIGN